jgi:6-pyruvoyl-tetrahydropterin synthase
MIAHSLPADIFGPAQKMHGATYIVDAEFSSPEVDEHNIVLDIGFAHEVLRSAIRPLNYQNLDNMPEFNGILTTTEFLARYIHQLISAEIKTQFSGTLKVTLGESHVAWASYESAIE